MSKLLYDLSIEVPTLGANRTQRFFVADTSDLAEAGAWIAEPPQSVIDILQPGWFLTVRRESSWIERDMDTTRISPTQRVLAFSRAVGFRNTRTTSRTIWDYTRGDEDMVLILPICSADEMNYREMLMPKISHFFRSLSYSSTHEKEAMEMERDWERLWIELPYADVLMEISALVGVPAGVIVGTLCKVARSVWRDHDEIEDALAAAAEWATGRDDGSMLEIECDKLKCDTTEAHRARYIAFSIVRDIADFVSRSEAQDVQTAMARIIITECDMRAPSRAGVTRTEAIGEITRKAAGVIRASIGLPEICFHALTHPTAEVRLK